jgi:protein arginine kinase
MRASVMLHLPALVCTKHIDKVFQAGAKMSLAVRGLYGEGTQPSSDFFQISNQVCLGMTENDVIDRLHRVVPQFIQYERKVREALLQSDRPALEDRCWRAYSVLRSARSITSEETLEYLSAVRLGVHLHLLPSRVTIDVVNELFVLSQPAHLQRLATGPLEPKARDVARATMIRTRLGPVE